MTARILVVDDSAANRKLLEARLNAEYFDVVTATNGMEALAICEKSLCDIVLLDVMMPDIDGFEVCRRLKSHIATAHLPIVLVTALDQPADRVRGLEAGADDFVTKPIDEMQLIARVRSLARLKVVIDELRNRANTTVALGMIAPFATPGSEDGRRGRLLLVDDRKSSSERLMQALAAASRRRRRAERTGGDVQGGRRQRRRDHRQPGSRQLRCLAAVQPDSRARAHAQPAHSRDRRSRGPRARPARAGTRHQRLAEPSGRPQRIARESAHAVSAEALRRQPA